ncbi:MAG: IPT/TIG domain-containing protein, partial [Shewanella sp.]
MLLLLDQESTQSISTVVPSSGSVGTELRIYGSGFTGQTAGTVGGVALTGFVVISDGEVRGTVAAGTGTGKVTVGAAISSTDFVV